MTDREIMLHRFCRKNIKKSTGKLAKYLGMTRREYEAAVKRGMAEEARELKANRRIPVYYEPGEEPDSNILFELMDTKGRCRHE